MHIAYLAVTIVLAAAAAFSGLGKLRRDPKIVHVIHDVVGVPLKYFPHLAACEFAGSLGLLVGIWWPILGLAAGLGLTVYFVRAIVSHVCVGDLKGIGPALFMLIISIAAVVLRAMSYQTGSALKARDIRSVRSAVLRPLKFRRRAGLTEPRCPLLSQTSEAFDGLGRHN